MYQFRNFFILSVLLVIAACEGLNFDNQPPEQKTVQTEIVQDTQTIAICLWEAAGLRAKPGRSKSIEYIEAVLLGERVVVLPDEPQRVEREKRTYIRVKLSDGKIGWVHNYLFGVDAHLAAIKKTTNIFRRPDPMMLKDHPFEAGEFVAVIEEKGEWLKVVGKERKKVGWIQKGDHITENENEVTVAVLYSRTQSEKRLTKKVAMLTTLVENKNFKNTFLAKQIQRDFKESSRSVQLPENKLYITSQEVDLRSSPTGKEENIVTQLEEGTVCTVLQIGPKDSVGKTKDVWYEIEFQGNQGWVYGHYTSKRSGQTN